ncbi:ABC exporter membrane fusion protein [Gloeobacter violaceus]|uniref:Gll1428 protein n=1 Tax=Gloeobacter violaceus (strain ATCC 29082 / PCC 7421) TaxID=251221 RepID=Q7NKP9_GLOVI|nr:ABC exporter membrane fusion protein [Gloeobacter violaceus]BAC89369.1 gll1428 [Gloeobacter violaceus PCC 7421]
MATLSRFPGQTASRWRVFLAIAAAVGGGAVLFYGLSARQPGAAPVVRAPSAPVVRAVVASGRLEPEGEVVRLAAPTAFEATRLEKLLVREGDRVKAGQAVAVLDRRGRYAATVVQARSQVKVAQARLAQVRAGAKGGELAAQRAGIDRLAGELEIARTEWERYAALERDGAISASALDSKRLAMRTLEGQLAQARNALVATAEVRPTDVLEAQAQVEQARSAQARAEADLEVAYVRALADGQVLKIHAWPGEVIGPEGIAEVGRTDRMYAVAEVYETEIGRVRPGQRARITSANGAFAGPLGGAVDQVGRIIAKKDVLNTDPAADIDARVVEVKIRLDPADGRRVSGLTNLQVDVAIEPNRSAKP